MNILHIHEQIEERGGTEKHIARLRKIFQDNRLNTHLLVVRPQSLNSFYWNESGSSSSYSIEAMHLLDRKLNELIRKVKPDIILIHGISFPAFIASLFKKVKCPIFRYMHEPRMVCPGHGKFWYRSESCCNKPAGIHCLINAYMEICAPRNPIALASNLKNTYFEVTEGFRYYTKVIVASDYMRKEAELAGLSANKIVKIAPPIDLHTDDYKPIPSGPPRILFVGRMSRTKGPHVLLRILASSLLKNTDWQLDFVGDGLIKDECIELAHKYGISEQTHFHGWKSGSELQSFYHQCSVVAFPTIYPEAFGGVGLEAFRCGRVVVGFDVGGVSEWLKNGVNGRLINPGDAQGFSEAILELLSDRVSLVEMGQKARRLVYEDFGPEILFERYSKIFL